MRLTALRLIAASSLLALLLSPANAATRPHYGGTLRIEMRAWQQALDPADTRAVAENAATPQLAPLVFETLTRLDANGKPQPDLALSWDRESERRWRFELRPGVRFSDGTSLTAALAAQSLATGNSGWTITAAGDAVVIASEQPLANVAEQLALTRNAVVLRRAGKLLGTGPFVVAAFQPGASLSLVANELHWQGRPYLDHIEVRLGRSLRDQAIDLDTGKADLIEVGLDQVARPLQAGRRLSLSRPIVFLALRFNDTAATSDSRVREALSLAIERAPIANVLFQRQAEASGGLLPNWISGYGFLFPVSSNLPKARQLRAELKQAPALTLRYPPGEPMARLMAERIALNAAEAGLSMRVASGTQAADIDLVSIKLPSIDSAVALQELARELGRPLPGAVTGPAESYEAAVRALKEHRIVPLVFVPEAYGVASRVNNWTLSPDGQWPLADVWVQPVNGVKP